MEEQVRVQVEDNSPSMEYILRAITYISWFLGVGIAHPRKCCCKCFTLILRVLYLTLCFISMTIDIITIYVFIHPGFTIDSDIFNFTLFIQFVIIYVSTYYFIYQGIGQYDKWPKLMDRIKELDRKIRTETLINNRPVKNVQALAILATFTWFPLFPIVCVLCDYYGKGDFIFKNGITYFFMSAQSLINSFVFDIVVYVLFNRFQTVNKLIGQLNQLSDTPWIAHKIRRIREMHNDICDLVIMVNDIHSLYLLFYSVNCLTTLTFTLLAIYINITETGFSIYLIGLTVLYTTQFGLTCWICTLVRWEFEKTRIIIHAIVLNYKPMDLDELNRTRHQSNLDVRTPLEVPDSEQNSNYSNSHNLNMVIIEHLLRKSLVRDCVRNEINDFLIQLQDRRIIFTVYNFFEISNALFCSFLGVIIAYSIVFIQFFQQIK